MPDLKYLTIDDLENFAVELKNAIKSSKTYRMGLAHIKENEDWLMAVEAEILERTLLQYETDGGVTN
jgi:hypothetical protein